MAVSVKTSIPLSQLQNTTTLETLSSKTELVSPAIVLKDSLEETIRYTPAITEGEEPRTSPSPLCPVQEESPVLFETPASVGTEPLSVKLAKRALSNDTLLHPAVQGVAKKPCLEDDNPCRMETEDKVTESSPLKRNVSPDPTEEVREDVNRTPPQDKTTPLDTEKSKHTLSLSTKRGVATPVKGEGSPLGQPRVLRGGNTRVASRRWTESENTSEPSEAGPVVTRPLLGKVTCNNDEVVDLLRACVCVCVYVCMCVLAYMCICDICVHVICSYCVLLQGGEVSCASCQLTLATGEAIHVHIA